MSALEQSFHSILRVWAGTIFACKFPLIRTPHVSSGRNWKLVQGIASLVISKRKKWFKTSGNIMEKRWTVKPLRCRHQVTLANQDRARAKLVFTSDRMSAFYENQCTHRTYNEGEIWNTDRVAVCIWRNSYNITLSRKKNTVSILFAKQFQVYLLMKVIKPIRKLHN